MSKFSNKAQFKKITGKSNQMKMEVLAVQQQYQTQYGVLGSNKVKDWTSTLTPPTTTITATAASGTATPQSNSNIPYLQKNTINKMKNSINKKSNRAAEVNNNAINHSGSMMMKAARASATNQPSSNFNNIYHNTNHTINTMNTMNTNSNNVQQNYLFYCDDIDAAAVNELSLRLLDELRAAKSRHLTCTEVSLPCDLTSRIAAEIIRVSEKEPCGIRGCNIYIEFEDEPNNSRRIASLKLDAETVPTFEVYLTLRQDHRGWTALLPQFMKSLARTITISPEFTITKHKLYSPQQKSSYSYGASRVSAAISTPTS